MMQGPENSDNPGFVQIKEAFTNISNLEQLFFTCKFYFILQQLVLICSSYY